MRMRRRKKDRFCTSWVGMDNQIIISCKSLWKSVVPWKKANGTTKGKSISLFCSFSVAVFLLLARDAKVNNLPETKLPQEYVVPWKQVNGTRKGKPILTLRLFAVAIFLFLLLVQNTTIKTIDFINGRGYIYTAEPDFNI